jgi:hypothetical protein
MRGCLRYGEVTVGGTAHQAPQSFETRALDRLARIVRLWRRPSNIVGLQEPRSPSLQAKGEAAVGRHTVPECLQVGLVELGRLATFGEGLLVVGVDVQPLAAGDQLETAEDQIKGVGPSRVTALRMGIKRTLRAG